MADRPIDTSSRPSMVSVPCAGDGCGSWIVVDRAFTGKGYCSACLHARIGSGDTVRVEPPLSWSSEHNPPPPPPVYPPGAEIKGMRVGNPDVSGYCLAHDPPADMHLMTTGEHDITVAFAAHDRLWHNPTGWLIGGPGGADGDVCNPCGGAIWDKDEGKVVKLPEPRHDLCERGNRYGRGRYCPCRHDRPYMRGIKPDGMPQPARPEPAPQEPVVSEPPPITGYLFDPEDFDDD